MNQKINIELRKPSVNLAENLKAIRTNLLYTPNKKVITFTSAEPDEGKTTVTLYLAESFARLGKKVCILEGDLRRPSIKKALKIKDPTTGLSEYLSGQNKENDKLVYSTSIQNLNIIFSGETPPDTCGLFLTDKFKIMISELRKYYDYVFIDTPPCLGASDINILGKESDGVVFIVRDKSVKTKELQKCFNQLQRAEIKIIGVILNRVKNIKKGYYYDY